MPAGAKPGERRGGRQRGSRNKRTIQRELMKNASRELEDERAKGKPLAKEILEKYMLLFHGMAAAYQPLPPDRAWVLNPETGQPMLDDKGKKIPVKPFADDAMFWTCSQHAIACAKELAKYQSPQFRSVQVSGNPEAPVEYVNRIERVIVAPPAKQIELQAVNGSGSVN